MFLWRESIAGGRLRETVAWEIERDATKIVSERDDDLAVDKAPRRIAMQQQKWLAGSFIDVVNASAVEIHKAMLDREQGAWNDERGVHERQPSRMRLSTRRRITL